MIISKDKTAQDNAKRQAAIFVNNLNEHLAAYAKNDLLKISGMKDLRSFTTNPREFFLKACSAQAKTKNLDGADPLIYAQLFNYSFNPDLLRKPIDPAKLEFVTLEKGKVRLADDFEEKISRVGMAEVEDPEEVEAAKVLMKLYLDYLYVENLLNGNGNPSMVKTRAMVPLGFTPMQTGQLKIDTVKRLAILMKEQPRDKFAERIAEASGNDNYKTF